MGWQNPSRLIPDAAQVVFPSVEPGLRRTAGGLAKPRKIAESESQVWVTDSTWETK